MEIQACIPRRLEKPVWYNPLVSSESESRRKVASMKGQKYVLEYVYYYNYTHACISTLSSMAAFLRV